VKIKKLHTVINCHLKTFMASLKAEDKGIWQYILGRTRVGMLAKVCTNIHYKYPLLNNLMGKHNKNSSMTEFRVEVIYALHEQYI